MRRIGLWFLGCLLFVFIGAAAFAFERHRAKNALFEELQEDLAAKKYDAVRNALHRWKFRDLAKRLSKIHDASFVRAFKTIEKVKGLKPKERLYAFQAALFLETEPFQHETYLAKEATDLRYDLEYNQESKKRFIHLDKVLGKGRKKIVYYSIFYDHKRPELVARAVSKESLAKEMATTKRFLNSVGIYAVHAISHVAHKEKKIEAIISKIYNRGSLYSLFSKIYKKKIRPLSTREKLRIASHIMQGLSKLHEERVVHRDLSARNYFVSMNESGSERDIEVVVADLERALHLDEVKEPVFDKKVQGNRTYMAPEAILRKEFYPHEFFAMDLYAVGCVLHELYYEARPVWRRSKLGSDGRSENETHQTLVHDIEMCTKKRRDELESKIEHTPEEEFELLVLQMVHVDPALRGSAVHRKEQLDRILTRL